jgi:hypothetical protein
MAIRSQSRERITMTLLNSPTLDSSLIFNASIGFAVLREILDGIMLAKTDEHRTTLAHQAIWAAEVIDKDLKAALKNVEAVAAAEVDL